MITTILLILSSIMALGTLVAAIVWTIRLGITFPAADNTLLFQGSESFRLFPWPRR